MCWDRLIDAETQTTPKQADAPPAPRPVAPANPQAPKPVEHPKEAVAVS